MGVTFTCEGRLDPRLAPDVIAYLEAYAPDFGEMRRRVWQDVCNRGGQLPCKKGEYNALLQRRYGILKRTANSLIADAQGRYRALLELKRTELAQLSQRIEAQEARCAKLQGKVDKAKGKARAGELDAKGIERLRRLKAALWQKRRKVARLRDKRAQRERELHDRSFTLGFGSRRLFRAQCHLRESGYSDRNVWLRDYRRARDSQVFYLGSKEECCGNQMCQLAPLPDGSFSIKVRKDGRRAPDAPRGSKQLYVEGTVRLGHLAGELRHNLLNQVGPVSVRLLLRDGRAYVQAMFSLDPEAHPEVTSKCDGVIGCDFNSGHIEVTETDRAGNIVGMWSHRLERHGCGKPAESEVRETVSSIGALALSRGKDIAIEALDFSGKKARRLKGVSKVRNRMLHTLDYSRFQTCIENMGARRGVGVVKVSPAYTSQIAAKRYNDQRKLPSHNGAAYVIARRAQGFHDSLS